jgi:hypothetical protein
MRNKNTKYVIEINGETELIIDEQTIESVCLSVFKQNPDFIDRGVGVLYIGLPGKPPDSKIDEAVSLLSKAM